MQQLLKIMARLRDPLSGCPWDREQTFDSIAAHTIEEAYEVADAISRGDMEELKDELGDLLFQIVFYAQMAQEQGRFDFQGVVDAINEKMLRRHPHVFADEAVADVAEQNAAWERHKAQERSLKSAGQASGQLHGVALGLPALLRAEKLQKRAAKVGFDWTRIQPVLGKVREELAELEQELARQSAATRLREEMGDLLFSCVNLARHLGVDAEGALRDANGKFERRFQALESVLAQRGRAPADASLEEMDAIWEQIKGDGGPWHA